MVTSPSVAPMAGETQSTVEIEREEGLEPVEAQAQVGALRESNLRETLLRFIPSIQNWLLGCGVHNPEDRNDLTQDIFMNALRKMDQLRNPGALPGWLRVMTRRTAFNFARRRKERSGGDEVKTVADRGDSYDPVVMALRSEQRDIVEGGLLRLSKIDSHSLREFYLRGKTLEEMKRDDPEDPPIGTIKRRLHYARIRLRREIERSIGTLV